MQHSCTALCPHDHPVTNSKRSCEAQHAAWENESKPCTDQHYIALYSTGETCKAPCVHQQYTTMTLKLCLQTKIFQIC